MEIPSPEGFWSHAASAGLTPWNVSACHSAEGSPYTISSIGQCFTWLTEGGPLTAIDLATGRELRAYPGSEIRPFLQEQRGEGKPPKAGRGIHGDRHWVRVSGKTVVANGDGSLRAWTMDGKPLWSFERKGFRVETPIIDAAHGLVCALRDGLVYTLQSFDIRSFNPKTCELKEVLNVSWNGRCQKPVATTTHFLLGQTAFIGKDFSGEMFAIARSGCAKSPVPAGGVVMFGPHTCACTTHLDGFLATTSHPAPAPFPDAQRLVSRNATAAPALPAPAPAVESLVSQSWPWFVISEAPVPASLEKAGWTFKVDPQAHRLPAIKGAASWSFVGDARLGGKFCVIGDRVVIGSHDGWVHGLDLATGAPRWRYFAAPAQRQIVANGMLTSTWPVMGVADLGSGQIVASAGTHTELEGGIRIVGLDAATGRGSWAKTLRKPASSIPPGGGRETKIAGRLLINAAPAVEAGKIVIAGGAHLGKLEFALDESEDRASPPHRRKSADARHFSQTFTPSRHPCRRLASS